MRIGHSYDLHNLLPGTGFYLGGIFIPTNFTVEAISDGDVLLHTIGEAIIGALGYGDLGQWFKPTTEKFSSTKIITHALTLLKKEGYQIVNIDTTVIIDEPKLSPFRDKIKATLGELLELSAKQINLKFTTTEKNFPTIIQAQTVILLQKL
ncbi:2-C-methyl-D-erythritol 2,4-cyclodiphosphate synthase [Spiroplasma chrysopicola]|uniref:2-C-methyl-D-erythritol 2,4-cyclodiphosphate synthase n=1 Tax=Spiroplasma chrysopicola DF-1 TaxID=1276227 RepID=R4UF48_9MOLU|nr:2-C-methyl-D-erythritol 2,4-cyclodiphosphate synthase [Spiroplasma chrysopicola]AGM24745.1 2-C-methyl-D-erythritol 2,4-cyclodiphosphate synthase [Spiroplasma chrysopicola DF-1]